MLVSCAECSRDGTGSTVNHSTLAFRAALRSQTIARPDVSVCRTASARSPKDAVATCRAPRQPASIGQVMRNDGTDDLSPARSPRLSLIGCRPEPAASADQARCRAPPPPPARTRSKVEQVRKWANVQRPAPSARDRNPFRFGSDAPPEATIAPGVSPESLPELPLPIPASDLRLIGIAGADEPDGGRTAIVTVGNDLVLARAGDTIAARYRVVRVGDDSLDVDRCRRQSAAAPVDSLTVRLSRA